MKVIWLLYWALEIFSIPLPGGRMGPWGDLQSKEGLHFPEAVPFARTWIIRSAGFQGCSPRPAEKHAATPRKKQALPRPVEIEKPAGCSGAKLAADSIDDWYTFKPTNYALEEERLGKSFIWLSVQIVTIFFIEIPFKSERIQCFPLSKHLNQ